MLNPVFDLPEVTRDLLIRIQPLMDAVDLKDMPTHLHKSMIKMERATGVATQEHTKRLLILNAKGVISDDEYIILTRQLFTPTSAPVTVYH